MNKKGVLVAIIVAILCLGIGFGGSYVFFKDDINSKKCDVSEEDKKSEDENKKEESSEITWNFVADGLGRDYVCKKEKNDGTEDGKEHCEIIAGYIKNGEKKYDIKLVRDYDGENKSFGYTYGFYINDKLVLDKRVQEIRKIDDSGKLLVITNGEASSTVPVMGSCLVDLEGNILKTLSNNTYYTDYEIIDYFSESNITEKAIYYNTCENHVLSKHRLSLNDLSDDKVVYEDENVLCSMMD